MNKLLWIPAIPVLIVYWVAIFFLVIAITLAGIILRYKTHIDVE
jgi:hypothetical protein